MLQCNLTTQKGVANASHWAILAVQLQCLASSTWYHVPAAGYAGGNHESSRKVSGWAKLRMARQLQMAGKAALVSSRVLRSMVSECL